eukprot:PITA_15890
MVRLVFRPYTQVIRTICTSVSLRASTRVSSGFALLTHSSTIFRVPTGVLTLEPFSQAQGQSMMHAPREGISPINFLVPRRFSKLPTRTHVRLLGPCFKTGQMESPPTNTMSAPCWFAPQVERRTSLRISTSDRDESTASICFPPGNFKHFLTLFSKSFSSFPRGTCSLSVSRPYLALDGIYHPIRVSFPNNLTCRKRLVMWQGPGLTGLSPSQAPPSKGLGPGPSLKTLLQTTIQLTLPPDFHAGLFPVCSPLLGESL